MGVKAESLILQISAPADQGDQEKKLASARNHTATHLLQAALKKVVGDQVNQAGSSVTPDRLRFDFTNFEPVTAQQLADVEALVNKVILKGQDVEISHMSLEEAKKAAEKARREAAASAVKAGLAEGATKGMHTQRDIDHLRNQKCLPLEYDGVKLVPTFHPSFLLRNPSAKKEAYADMLLIKSLLDELKS